MPFETGREYLLAQDNTAETSRNLLDDASEDFLGDKNIARDKDGKVLELTYAEAEALCKQEGKVMPTARQLARFMNPDAIKESYTYDQELKAASQPNATQADKDKIKGYYQVTCLNEDGSKDTFYFNNDIPGGRKPQGEFAKYDYWLGSTVLGIEVDGKPKYAHVFYGWRNGGGGDPADHEVSRHHGVLLVDKNAEPDQSSWKPRRGACP